MEIHLLILNDKVNGIQVLGAYSNMDEWYIARTTSMNERSNPKRSYYHQQITVDNPPKHYHLITTNLK